MWLGTTITGLRAIPNRRSSIAPITISAVLPAPTSWKSPTEGSESIRATAARWCGRGVKFFTSPGKDSRSPSTV